MLSLARWVPSRSLQGFKSELDAEFAASKIRRFGLYSRKAVWGGELFNEKERPSIRLSLYISFYKHNMTSINKLKDFTHTRVCKHWERMVLNPPRPWHEGPSGSTIQFTLTTRRLNISHPITQKAIIRYTHK
jgi:hypothetical protein